MNLSLISQKPLAATTQGVLAALQTTGEYGHYVNEVRVAQPSNLLHRPIDSTLCGRRGGLW